MEHTKVTDKEYTTIFELSNSNITANGYIEFSNNVLISIIYHICKKFDCFFFNINLDNTVINVTSNNLSTYFTGEFMQPSSKKVKYPICYFQYYDVKGDTIEENTSIILRHNNYKRNIKDALISAERSFNSDY